MGKTLQIPFNKPFLSGNELSYIKDATGRGKLSGNGFYTERCRLFFQEQYGFNHTLLTSSCTDALEMAAILSNVGPGDEVIAPSFSFVSSVNPFVLRGANIVFCDVRADHPCIDERAIESLITPRTRVIVVVHYAGIACNMDVLLDICHRHGILLVEDAAHAIAAYYNQRPLGGIGHFGAFSFHETKNVIAGEGGLIAVNDAAYWERAEIVLEKGTDRSKFFRGETDKYNWVDIGSSFLASEITAAFLYAQLENINRIQQKRREIWDEYYRLLTPLRDKGYLSLPMLPAYATNNAHLFYVLARSGEERTQLLHFLRDAGIMAIFHYQPLHSSPYFSARYKGAPLPQTDKYANQLFRLPLYYELGLSEVSFIVERINAFYAGR
ncbi:MAG: dTDP-4-amino-4,6-dideoxygalactose transaminase [Bacteroidetes bacterium]|nr:dTDP-4-amino-4,6-dideoxygalactose transaminase [Bacteroidota bacterium]